MRATRAVSLLMVLAGLLLAAETVMVVRTLPDVTYAGSSGWLLALEVAAGLSLVGAGVVATGRAATRACGQLAGVAGAAWLTREWASPAAGSPLVFTAGLVLGGVAPAMVADAAFRFPGLSRRAAPVVTVGYAVVVGWQGLAPTLFSNPRAEGCTQCPVNLLLLTHQDGWSGALERTGSWAGAAWAVSAAVGLMWAGATASPAVRRVAAPFLIPVCALLVLTAWMDVRSGLGWTPQALVDDRVWILDAGLLTSVAAGLVYERVHARRVRVSLARLAVEFADNGTEGALRTALARLVRDPTLTVLYPLADRSLVDARGHPAPPPPHRQSTALSRAGQPIAYLLHEPGVLDDDAVMDEIAAVATLSIDHERHQAMAFAQIAALRTSRARIVAARDAERRRLERDLHDGAQQRLVTLALLLRLAQTTAPAEGAQAALLNHCGSEVNAALCELRDLAHGIYPAVLADEGIEAALQSLSETAPVSVETIDIADRRYPSAVESTAYFALAQLVRHCVRDMARLAVTQTGPTLRFEVDVDALAEETVEGLQDRVGALDGRLTVARGAREAATVVMELPCA